MTTRLIIIALLIFISFQIQHVVGLLKFNDARITNLETAKP
jgi:hypothetical protein